MKKLSFILLLLTLSGCAHVVSPELRERVDKTISTEALFKEPEVFKGRLVILGGIIVSSRNAVEGTYLEVLERPLDSLGRPKDTDISRGRFIILYEGYLDSAVYSKGREVTVAGEVMGKMVRPLGEMEYPYPLIKSKELHLFEPRRGLPIRFEIGIFHTF
jgi:outer membrane lipoprotein